MRYNVLFEARAKRELEDAYTYYNKQQADLGARFLAKFPLCSYLISTLFILLKLDFRRTFAF